MLQKRSRYSYITIFGCNLSQEKTSRSDNRKNSQPFEATRLHARTVSHLAKRIRSCLSLSRSMFLSLSRKGMLAPWIRFHPPAVVLLLSSTKCVCVRGFHQAKNSWKLQPETAQKNLRKACMFFYRQTILSSCFRRGKPGEGWVARDARNNIFILFYYISLEIYFFFSPKRSSTKMSGPESKIGCIQTSAFFLTW